MCIDGKIIAGKIEFSGINNHKRLNGTHVRIESPGSDFIMIHTRVKVSKMVIKEKEEEDEEQKKSRTIKLFQCMGQERLQHIKSIATATEAPTNQTIIMNYQRLNTTGKSFNMETTHKMKLKDGHIFFPSNTFFNR